MPTVFDKIDLYWKTRLSRHVFYSKYMSWFNHGDLTFKGRSEKELKKQYLNCSKDKCVFFNGKLFYCACSAFGSELNVFKIKETEYVDFRSSKNSNDMIIQLKQLKRKAYLTACNYCNWGTDSFIPIKVAEQIKK